MPRARRTAIGFVSIVWGAVFFGGFLAADGDACAAARRATRKRTASAQTASPSLGEGTSDRSRDASSSTSSGATSGATVNAGAAPSGRRAHSRRSSATPHAVQATIERDAERTSSARSTDKAANADKTSSDKTPNDKTTADKTPADRPLSERPLADKSPTDKAPTDKSLGAKLGGDGALRNADLRPGVAKTPSDAAPSGKSTAEKFAGDTAPADGSEPSAARQASDVASGRRDVSRDAPSSATPAPSGRAVTLTLEGPVFDGGDVPRAAAALERMRGSFAKCVPSDAALTKNEATIDLRFLVRAPGRAEGVDVEKARGVSGDVVKCMTSILARSYIGAPSDDPVGVAVTVRVRKD